MKKNIRYKIDCDYNAVERLISKEEGLEVAEGCLIDNYRFYDTRLKWSDDDGKHNVYFDEVIILETYLHAGASYYTLYGIKYKGITESEKKIIEKFEKLLEEQHEREDEYLKEA